MEKQYPAPLASDCGSMRVDDQFGFEPARRKPGDQRQQDWRIGHDNQPRPFAPQYRQRLQALPQVADRQ